MNIDTATDSSYTTPWTVRAFDTLAVNPVWVGVGLTVTVLAAYLVGRILVDGAAHSSPDDLRVAITHILQAGYTAFAFAFLMKTARKTVDDLGAVSRHSPESQTIVERVGKHRRGVLVIVGASSCLALGIAITNATTPDTIDPWDWQHWTYDIFWHRFTTVFLFWWTGGLCYVIVVESERISHLSGSFESVDPLDLAPYRPLIRQGLTNVLLLIGAASVSSLLWVESRYGPMLIGSWLTFVVFAWVGMMLPLRGIRRIIAAAKGQELEWCRVHLKSARNELKSGGSKQPSIADIIAYRTTIENIRNWPFDSPTLARFALYVMIPLGSWLGGALVERGVDFFLS